MIFWTIKVNFYSHKLGSFQLQTMRQVIIMTSNDHNKVFVRGNVINYPNIKLKSLNVRVKCYFHGKRSE